MPTTAASAASGCTGLLRAFLGEAAFFGVDIGQSSQPITLVIEVGDVDLDQRVKLWEAATGKLLATLQGARWRDFDSSLESGWKEPGLGFW